MCRSIVQLGIAAQDFEEIVSILEICGFKIMAQNYGCDDGDFTEILPEDRSEVFDPTEYDWQIW